MLDRGGTGIKIKTVDAATGASKGELDVTSVSGVTYTLASLGVIGNDLYASNYVGPNGTLYVYKWVNGTGKLERVQTVVKPGIDVGEHMSTYNDGTEGRIAFCSFKDGITTMKWFAVTGGVVNPEPNTVTLNPAQPGNRSCFEVAFEKDGSFWVNSKDSHPRHFNADGSHIETLKSTVKVSGTGITVFEFGSRRYIAYVVTFGGTDSWSNASLEIVEITDGASNARSLGFYPAGGLGEPSCGSVVVTSAVYEISDDGMKVGNADR